VNDEGRLSGGATPRVSFLIAGAQKAGTSALFEYLRRVPALELPDVKEAHFFDDEQNVDWSDPDYRPYHALFADDRRSWGEATPIYTYWPNSIERIHRYNPDMRIILLLRDPVERAWSHWKMEFAKRKETEPFAWCIRAGRDRLSSGDPQAPGHHRVYSYVERGFYGRQLARWLGLFPRRQLLLLHSDDLDRAPDTVVARICDFLGVTPPSEPLIPKRVREAAAIAYPSILTDADRTLLRSLYAPDLDDFARLGGPEAAAWIAQWKSRNIKVMSDPVVA
jgi:hypothetical protein